MLVTIYSEAVQNALNEHSDGVDRWIGLKKNELEDGKIFVKSISILEQSNFVKKALYLYDVLNVKLKF